MVFVFREKGSAFLAVLSLAMMLACLTLVVPAIANASSSNKLKTITKYSEKKVTTKKYDITGDGKADTIRIVPKGEDPNLKLDVRVNGKRELKNWPSCAGYSAQIAKLKRRPCLVLTSCGYNDDNETLVYAYSNGKLRKVLDLSYDAAVMSLYGMHYGTEAIRATSSTITVRVHEMAWVLGYFETDLKFKFVGKKLKLAGNIFKVHSQQFTSGNEVVYYTAMQNIKTYAKCSSAKKTRRISKGTKFKVKKIYLKGPKMRFLCVTKKGKKSWLEAAYTWEEDEDAPNVPDIKGCVFAG